MCVASSIFSFYSKVATESEENTKKILVVASTIQLPLICPVYEHSVLHKLIIFIDN